MGKPSRMGIRFVASNAVFLAKWAQMGYNIATVSLHGQVCIDGNNDVFKDYIYWVAMRADYCYGIYFLG